MRRWIFFNGLNVMHESKALKQRSGRTWVEGKLRYASGSPFEGARINSGQLIDGEDPSYHWETVPRLGDGLDPGFTGVMKGRE